MRVLKIQEDFDSKISEKQMRIWKSEMAQKQLADRVTNMAGEIDRLQKVKDLGESIARLPSACLDDINTEQQVREAKESALASALDEMKGKNYDALV